MLKLQQLKSPKCIKNHATLYNPCSFVSNCDRIWYGNEYHTSVAPEKYFEMHRFLVGLCPTQERNWKVELTDIPDVAKISKTCVLNWVHILCRWAAHTYSLRRWDYWHIAPTRFVIFPHMPMSFMVHGRWENVTRTLEITTTPANLANQVRECMKVLSSNCNCQEHIIDCAVVLRESNICIYFINTGKKKNPFWIYSQVLTFTRSVGRRTLRSKRLVGLRAPTDLVGISTKEPMQIKYHTPIVHW